jgi:hypothetical protein
VDAERQALALAAGRIAFGLSMFLAPTRSTQLWLGEDAERPGTVMVIRGLGAREVALGVGLLTALRREDADPGRWLEAAIVGDVADATASLLGGRPSLRRLVGVVVAGTAATAAINVRRQLG